MSQEHTKPNLWVKPFSRKDTFLFAERKDIPNMGLVDGDHFLVKASSGEQLFMKTSVGSHIVYFMNHLLSTDSPHNRTMLEKNLQSMKTDLQASEAAWKLAHFLQVPMPETHYMEYFPIDAYLMELYRQGDIGYIFDDPAEFLDVYQHSSLQRFVQQLGNVPWSVANYIPNTEDRSHGSNFSSQSLEQVTIQEDLARIAVLKTVMQATGDNGQMVEDTDHHRVFAVDTHLFIRSNDRVRDNQKIHEPSDICDMVSDIVLQANTFLATDPSVLTIQLDAIANGLADETFAQLELLAQQNPPALLRNVVAPLTADPLEQQQVITAIQKRAQFITEALRFLANPTRRNLVIEILLARQDPKPLLDSLRQENKSELALERAL